MAEQRTAYAASKTGKEAMVSNEATTELATHWQRWKGLVSQLAQGRTARGLSSNEYRSLHSALLQACRRVAENAESEHDRSAVQNVERLVSPWVSFEALSGAGKKNIERLLGRCAEIDGHLNGVTRSPAAASQARNSGRRASQKGGEWKILLAAFLLGLCIGTVYLFWNQASVHMNPQMDAQLWMVRLKWTLINLGFVKVFSIVTIAVVCLGGMFLYATKKS